MRLWMKVVGVLVLLVVLVVVGIFVYVDRIAKVAIERGAAFALGLDTSVDSVRIRFVAGKFGLSGLRVANPSGFETAHFVSLDRGDLHVDLGSLRGPAPVVSVFELEGIDLNVERNKGKTNYGVILESLQRMEGGEKERPAETGGGKKFTIRELTIKDVTAHVKLVPVGGELSAVDVKIPEIRLKDVGSDSGGVPLAELVGVVVKAILRTVVEKGANLPTAIAGSLRGGLGKLGGVSMQVSDVVTESGGKVIEKTGELLGEAGGKAGEKIGAMGEATGEAGEKAGAGARKALEGVKGLFKKKE